VVRTACALDEAENLAGGSAADAGRTRGFTGIVGLTRRHAKMALIVRTRERDNPGGVSRRFDRGGRSGGLRYYAHLGTRHYHPRTARM